MKIIAVIFVVFVIFSDYCLSQRSPNSPIMQMKRSVEKKLCVDNDYSQDVIARIEDCNRMDPHYKMDELYKECRDIVPNGSQTWNEKRKMNCKIMNCYERKYQTAEYNSTWNEIRKMSDFEIEKRQTQKFECLEKVMSMK